MSNKDAELLFVLQLNSGFFSALLGKIRAAHFDA